MMKSKRRDTSLAFRPGRRQATFVHLVSPLGYNPAGDNDYSPATTVNGSRTGKGGGASQSESARAARRNEQ